MGINHCCAHMAVDKKFLDCPYIVSVFQQVSCKRMTKGVATCVFIYASFNLLCEFFVNFLYEILIRKWVFENKRTVPALTCPYNYRHRMMTILFLLQAWHGYRFTFTQAFGIFGGRCVTRVLLSKNVFVPETCFFRFAVTDYMCLIQDAFPGIFFWIAIQPLLFYFATKTLFFSHKKDCFF